MSFRPRGKPVRFLVSAATLGFLFAHADSASAQNSDPGKTIIQEWNDVQIPPAPGLESVKLNPKKTMLLVMDLNKVTCIASGRPRCAASLPRLHELLTAARAHHVLVIHTLSGVTTAADIPDEVAPLPTERVISPRTDKLFGRMDKFFDSDLEESIRSKGIDTVIAVGTSANGAVLYTASSAAARKFKVVVPVDGMSAETAYQEQYTAFQFVKGPVIRGNIALTRVDLVSFDE